MHSYKAYCLCVLQSLEFYRPAVCSEKSSMCSASRFRFHCQWLSFRLSFSARIYELHTNCPVPVPVSSTLHRPRADSHTRRSSARSVRSGSNRTGNKTNERGFRRICVCRTEKGWLSSGLNTVTTVSSRLRLHSLTWVGTAGQGA